MPPTTPSGRRRSSSKAALKSRMLRTVRSSVASASIKTWTTSVEPPKAASSVSTSRIASPPRGRKSRESKTVSMPVEAKPSSTVTTPITTRKGAGRRASWPPSASTAGPTPGMAPETGFASGSRPRASRRPSISARAEASSDSITTRPAMTPTPATTPKSPLAGIGELRLVRKETTVVTAASESGMITARSPRRAATRAPCPSPRCSR